MFTTEWEDSNRAEAVPALTKHILSCWEVESEPGKTNMWLLSPKQNVVDKIPQKLMTFLKILTTKR